MRESGICCCPYCSHYTYHHTPCRLPCPHCSSQAPLPFSDSMENIDALKEKIHILEDENRHLTETVSWMHETIWKLVRKNNFQFPK